MPERRVLVANRGEIAARIIRTLKKNNIESVAVFSKPDIDHPFVQMADISVAIGDAEPALSYLNMDKLIHTALQNKCDSIHPGYGFLSENSEFAKKIAEAGLIFIGPDPETIARMGDKVEARKMMIASGVPVVPGFDDFSASFDQYKQAADSIGYPVMVKAKAGGGGKGMRIVKEVSQLETAIDSARREALSAFGDAGIFIEKFIEQPRHIEVQVFGDGDNYVHLFERECSVQRRHQKIIEESPSTALTQEIRDKICEAAVNAAKACNYKGAGTVEFIYSDRTGEFYFLEMNTRLQVEHPVTEMNTGIDLVELQLKVAYDGKLPITNQDEINTSGHSIEVRLYAEDPANNFLPTTGRIHRFEVQSKQLRLDSGFESGNEISIHYDPMLAKLIVHSESRKSAIDEMIDGLESTIWFGPATNLHFLKDVLNSDAFRSGNYTTALVEDEFENWKFESPEKEVHETLSIAALLYNEGGPSLQNTDVSNQGDVYSKKDRFQLWT